MAYAASRDPPGNTSSAPRLATSSFHALDVTGAGAEAQHARETVAHCSNASVVRCEAPLDARSSQESDAPRVRLMIRLPIASYARVLHCPIEAMPSSEIGRLFGWRDRLTRCRLRHG